MIFLLVMHDHANSKSVALFVMWVAHFDCVLLNSIRHS